MESWIASPADRDGAAGATRPASRPTWSTLSRAARLYVALVIASGAALTIAFFPNTVPPPLVLPLLAFAGVTSTWKVTLPLPVSNGSTLSVSYAANLMTLLLLGPRVAVMVAVAGSLVQCTYKVKQPYPAYRTVFSAGAAATTMALTGIVYSVTGGPVAPFDSLGLARPLVAAIATYFVVNTGLVAGAISMSTGRSLIATWREDFLWSGASFMVAGTGGALAAVVIERGEQWKAVLLVAPIYLTYRTYEVFVGRLEDQKRHMTEMSRLHDATVRALRQARDAECALAAEKERLARTLADMTRLQRTRDELLEREQAARASAEQANRLKDEFLAIVSHELRTPLTAILGWADMLRRNRLPEGKRDRACATIYASAKRQAELIDDLLDVSRIMSGKLRLRRTVVDVAEIVREAVQVVRPGADAKGVRIIVETRGSSGVVYGDGARLQQVVWNLLSNAVKYTPAGGIVQVLLRAHGGEVELVVADTGEGIPPEFLASVFEPFRQADGSTTRVHRGLGLGLSIVKHLVEAHHGTVIAESDGLGRGATFKVRLPLVSSERARDDRPFQEGDAQGAADSLAGVNVLVVDDDADTREIVAAHLHGRDASVVTAASAAEALEVLSRDHVDVLLADIGMPGEDGYALIRKVRSRGDRAAAVPAAALTAFAREEDRQQALRAGFQLHLPKPVDESTLVAAVASLSTQPPA